MKFFFALIATVALAACATTPTAPAVDSDAAPAPAAAESAPEAPAAEAAPADAPATPAPAEGPAFENEAQAESYAAMMSKPEETNFPNMSWGEVETALKNGAVLCDARSKKSYDGGHIAGAVHTGKTPHQAGVLPEDKATQVIFYCGGPACRASWKAAVVAKAVGYTNVAEYKGGYPEWLEANEAK